MFIFEVGDEGYILIHTIIHLGSPLMPISLAFHPYAPQIEKDV